jgi:dCMP deaminase
MSFRIASKTALKSPFSQHRVGAVIVKNGRVLSTGYNELRYTRELKKLSVHAEEAAILELLKSRRQSSLVGADLYVTRITPGNRVGLAKPCDRCQKLIQATGIRRVFYTTNGDYNNVCLHIN